MTFEELGKKILEDKEHKDWKVVSFGTSFIDGIWYHCIWLNKDGCNIPILFEKEEQILSGY